MVMVYLDPRTLDIYLTLQGFNLRLLYNYIKSHKIYSCLFVSSTNLFHQQNLQLFFTISTFLLEHSLNLKSYSYVAHV